MLLLAGLLCSLGLAAFAASCVVNPVKRLSRAVVEVGNLKLDALIDVKTQVREIALLAGIIEKMRGALHRNQNRLEFLAYHGSSQRFAQPCRVEQRVCLNAG